MDEAEVVPTQRPGWVWVISIFFFLSAGWTLLSFYLMHSGAIPLNAAQVAYFDRLTALDYISSVGIGLVHMSAAITLFFLWKVPFYLFATALTVNLLLAMWHVATKGWVAALSGSGKAKQTGRMTHAGKQCVIRPDSNPSKREELLSW